MFNAKFNVPSTTAWLDLNIADLETNNAVVWKVWEQLVSVAATVTIDLTDVNLIDWETNVIADWEKSVISVAASTAGTVSSYLGKKFTTFADAPEYKSDDVPNDSIVIGHVVVENGTWSDFTVEQLH